MAQDEIKTFKFEFGGMFTFYSGRNLGEAIRAMLEHRANYLDLLQSITEEEERKR